MYSMHDCYFNFSHKIKMYISLNVHYFYFFNNILEQKIRALHFQFPCQLSKKISSRDQR